MLCTGNTKMTNQNKNGSIRTQYIVKCYTEGVLRKKQYHHFFHGAPKGSSKKDFCTRTLSKTSKSK